MSTKNIAHFIVTTCFNELPPKVVAKAKMCILDILGSSLAAHETKSANAVRRMVQAMGGREESTLIGVGVKAPVPLAAWANSVLANALDMDDGSFWAKGHAGHHGAMVIPSSLSIAECKGLSGKNLIEGIVVGYEVGIRAGYIMSSLGIHHGGTMGCFGAAAASSKLLRLNAEETVHALGIADAHNPVGSTALLPVWPKVGFGISMTKEMIGWGTLTGVAAAILSQEGFTGPVSVFNSSHADNIPVNDLGSRFEILNVYHKPYCSCRLTHTTLDGVLELVQKYNLNSEEIIRIKVGSSSVAIGLNNYQPKTIEDMQFSIPFVVGAALVDGEVGPEQVNERRLHDRKILEQAKKVKLEVNQTIETLKVAGELQATVKIETKDGRNFETSVVNAKGDPENPFTDDELREKFRSLTTRWLGERQTKKVINCVDDLENMKDIKELMSLVSSVDN